MIDIKSSQAEVNISLEGALDEILADLILALIVCYENTFHKFILPEEYTALLTKGVSRILNRKEDTNNEIQAHPSTGSIGKLS